MGVRSGDLAGYAYGPTSVWNMREWRMPETGLNAKMIHGTYYSSSSIGTIAHCGLWPVEQRPSIFFLSATSSLHLLTPSTWRSVSTSSFHPFLGLPLLLFPSSSWVKIFLGILSSSILSRWPNHGTYTVRYPETLNCSQWWQRRNSWWSGISL